MIKVTADRALRGNINHTHSDILMDLETNHGIPSHFTLSLQCIQMSCLGFTQIVHEGGLNPDLQRLKNNISIACD